MESLRLRILGSNDFETVVRAHGPIRDVIDRVYRDGSGNPHIEMIERFMLYADAPGVDVHLIFRNLTDRGQSLPGWIDNKSLFSARLGPPIARRLDRTEVVSVHKYRSTRPNLLWINPETERALGWRPRPIYSLLLPAYVTARQTKFP